MIPELGNFALILALSIGLVLSVVPIYGAAKGYNSWMRLARPAATGQFVFVAISFGCLAYAFLTDDFSVQYVATNSNSLLPTQYKFASIWGGHEGSLLLWTLFLAAWMLLVTVFSRRLPEEMVARVLGVMGFVSVGFLLFMLLTSNPFDRMLPAAVDGRDLNPLLQDPGLVIHPPMLYMGYVGFSVAFAFAIAALIGGKLDSAWIRWTRPWTTAAWIFLTLGIALGSWWAYYELGWGGWWFWDPVENASFMPWLMGTALIHSLAVTEKRGAFRNWTVLLAIFTFSFSLLGTFLVRSGVLVSVHAFASDPERGLFILLFLGVVIISSLILFAIRAPKVGIGGDFAIFSREALMLVGNVLLVGACCMVLLGTIYPIIYDAILSKKMSVGPPYFNAVFIPMMVPLICVMGLGPISRWKKDDPTRVAQQIRLPLVAAIVSALIVPFLMGEFKILVVLGMFMAFWILYAIGFNYYIRWITLPNASFAKKLTLIPISFQGMTLAHIGVAVSFIGVTLVSNYQIEEDVRMATGDTLELSGYTFRFNGSRRVPGPNYMADQGEFTVTKNGKVVTVLYPEKRQYKVQRNMMTEAGIDAGLTRDLYVSLGEPLGGGAWSVRVYIKPFVDWIWAGAAIMAIGGLFAVSDKRYRLRRRVEKPAKSGALKAAEV